MTTELPENAVSPASSIISAGFRLPIDRLRQGKAQRSVARTDEDAVTLAVEASAGALANGPGPAVLILATITPPYTEGGNTQPIVEMLGLSPETLSFELTSGIRDGLLALRLASSLIAGGSGPVLVVGAHAERQDRSTGDGAVALLLGPEDDDALVRIRPGGAHVEELRDTWRLRDSLDREVADKSFVDSIGTRRLGLEVTARSGAGSPVMVVGPGLKSSAQLERELGGAGDGVVSRCGRLGLAHPLARIAYDLSGPTGLLAMSGGLAEHALCEPGPRYASLKANLEAEMEAGVAVDSVSNDPLPVDFDPYSSVPRSWRERGEDLRLEGILPAGSEPPARHPAFGEVLTFTRDYVYPGTEPVSMAAVDIEGGGRFFGQVTAGDRVGIGDRVRLVPRRLHAGGGMVQWFWKVGPCQ